jgi:hypothetical protein
MKYGTKNRKKIVRKKKKNLQKEPIGDSIKDRWRLFTFFQFLSQTGGAYEYK